MYTISFALHLCLVHRVKQPMQFAFWWMLMPFSHLLTNWIVWGCFIPAVLQRSDHIRLEKGTKGLGNEVVTGRARCPGASTTSSFSARLIMQGAQDFGCSSLSTDVTDLQDQRTLRVGLRLAQHNCQAPTTC